MNVLSKLPPDGSDGALKTLAQQSAVGVEDQSRLVPAASISEA